MSVPLISQFMCYGVHLNVLPTCVRTATPNVLQIPAEIWLPRQDFADFPKEDNLSFSCASTVLCTLPYFLESNNDFIYSKKVFKMACKYT